MTPDARPSSHWGELATPCWLLLFRCQYCSACTLSSNVRSLVVPCACLENACLADLEMSVPAKWGSKLVLTLSFEAGKPGVSHFTSLPNFLSCKGRLTSFIGLLGIRTDLAASGAQYMSRSHFLREVPRPFLLICTGLIWAGPVLTLSGSPGCPDQHDFSSCLQGLLCSPPSHSSWLTKAIHK